MTSEQNSGSSVSTLNYTDSFGYDSAGNPTTWKGASQSFNSDNQRSASGYAFDGNGNATTYGGGTLTYDPMDKLISLATSGTAYYRYRADGLRAWKGWNVSIPTSGGIPVTGATYYLYDGGNPVVEMDSSGTVTAINVFASDGLVARKETGTWKYYQFDPQGSVAQRTNSSGTVVNSSMYDAYGKYVIVPFPASDVYGWNGRWGYYYDTDSGLYLCQQRYYDANQGRWLNRDPIGYAGGVNVYEYCGGSPVGAKDGFGLAKVYVAWRGVIFGNNHGMILIEDETSGVWWVAEGGPHWQGINPLGYLDGGTAITNDKAGAAGMKLLADDDLPATDWVDRINKIKPPTTDYVVFPKTDPCHPNGNSNSWVRKVLEFLGLSTKPPTKDWLPGWDVDPWFVPPRWGGDVIKR